MANAITWTHVDKLVRNHLEDKGMIGSGNTDAEVTHEFIRFLLKSLTIAEANLTIEKRRVEDLRTKIERLQQAKPLGKTKQRLAALEVAVGELEARLERNCI